MYIVLEQIVYKDEPDNINIVYTTDSLEEANDYLVKLHSKYYSTYDEKLLQYDRLFVYNWNGSEYTIRTYYRIMKI